MIQPWEHNRRRNPRSVLVLLSDPPWRRSKSQLTGCLFLSGYKARHIQSKGLEKPHTQHKHETHTEWKVFSPGAQWGLEHHTERKLNLKMLYVRYFCRFNFTRARVGVMKQSLFHGHGRRRHFVSFTEGQPIPWGPVYSSSLALLPCRYLRSPSRTRRGLIRLDISRIPSQGILMKRVNPSQSKREQLSSVETEPSLAVSLLSRGRVWLLRICFKLICNLHQIQVEVY